MSWLDALRHRVRTVMNPGGFELELDEEMRLHVELDAMQQRDGTHARRRFGNRTYYKEETRRMTWLASLDVLRQDARYAWRAIVRTPSFTILVVLTLALGIGLNAATFAILDRLYLRMPGGMSDPSRIQRVWAERQFSDGRRQPSLIFDYPMYSAVAEATGGTERLALFVTNWSLRQGPSLSAPKIRGVFASANYWTILGVRPALGRFFTPAEDELGSGARVAVVSHRFWKERLDGDSGVIGRKLPVTSARFGTETYTVIGVAEPAFTGIELQAADVWMPLSTRPVEPSLQQSWWKTMNVNGLQVFRRIAEDEPPGAFEQRATPAFRRHHIKTFPQSADSLGGGRVHTGSIIIARGPGEPDQESIISTRLGGVAIIVLLIACANIVNLLLARAVNRRREIAVRLALGVTRWRLVRLITTETVLLAMIAAAAATVAAWWGGNLLRKLLMPGVEWFDSALDLRLVLFTFGVALLAGLVAGVIPALQSSNPRLSSALKEGSREGTSGRSRLRSALVMTQAALSVTLLVGAALFVRSLHNVQRLDIGYDSDRLLFSVVQFDDGQEPPAALLGAALREVAERLRSRPGIEEVARANIEPMRGFSMMNFFTGADSLGSFAGNLPFMTAVSPSFFRATGMRVTRGASFSEDERGIAPPEVVVNEAMAKLVWPRRDPVGQCMRFQKRENPCYIVVGVVENARFRGVIEEKPQAAYYLPLGNMPTQGWDGWTIIVRARSQTVDAAAAELRSALRRSFPAAHVSSMQMTQRLEPEYRPWRLGATLFTAFGLLALVVALVGIYSTVAYAVTRRTQEFGVRMALGARMADILRQVLGEGLRTVAIGVAFGIVISIAAGRLIAALLYGIEPWDPFVMLSVGATLLVVAALAALVPAWRASRVDPVTALRAE